MNRKQALQEKYRLFIAENPFIPIEPTPKQLEFLMSDKREVLFGGAGGGGKSIALLAAASMYMMIPGYSAIIFRLSHADLAREGALKSVSMEWLSGLAEWGEREFAWHVPGGGTLAFGYLDAERDRYSYASAAYQFIGFDESSQIEPGAYLYMHARLRRRKGVSVPLRIWSASNPGGRAHNFVRERFITNPTKDRAFIPASLWDNPHLDQEQYVAALNELDPVTKARILHGDWEASEVGMFHVDDLLMVDPPEVPQDLRYVRFWDLAASTPKRGRDPDYTVGLKTGTKDGQFWITDMKRVRKPPGEVEALILDTAQEDGTGVAIRMEEEGGASGKTVTNHYAKKLAGYDFKGVRSTGNKADRARPLAAAIANGLVYLVRRHWTKDLLEEFSGFPTASLHDDTVDSSSGAFNELAAGNPYYPSEMTEGQYEGEMEWQNQLDEFRSDHGFGGLYDRDMGF